MNQKGIALKGYLGSKLHRDLSIYKKGKCEQHKQVGDKQY